jgi:hypothetical protein
VLKSLFCEKRERERASTESIKPLISMGGETRQMSAALARSLTTQVYKTRIYIKSLANPTNSTHAASAATFCRSPLVGNMAARANYSSCSESALHSNVLFCLGTAPTHESTHQPPCLLICLMDLCVFIPTPRESINQRTWSACFCILLYVHTKLINC